MQMIRPLQAIIIDDEARAIANLETLLTVHPEINVIGTITDPTHAVGEISAKEPDLIFLDIQMPEKSGFEIVSELLKDSVCPAIIFVTAFDQFAIEAIRHAAFDFLVKPVNPAELKQAIKRLSDQQVPVTRQDQLRLLIEKTVTRHRIKINTAGGFTMIDPSDIVYIQADWNYAEIHTSKSQHEIACMNIGTLESQLPASDFFRISRSVIINVRFLKKVSRKNREATLIKDAEIFTFAIPLLNIRKLEHFLESSR